MGLVLSVFYIILAWEWVWNKNCDNNNCSNWVERNGKWREKYFLFWFVRRIRERNGFVTMKLKNDDGVLITFDWNYGSYGWCII